MIREIYYAETDLIWFDDKTKAVFYPTKSKRIGKVEACDGGFRFKRAGRGLSDPYGEVFPNVRAVLASL